MTSPWRALCHRAGVPVTFATTADGRVSTNAAVVASRRSGGAPGHHAWGLLAALGEHLSLRAEVGVGGVVVCDLTQSDEWLARLPSATSAVLAEKASSIRAEGPAIRAAEGVMPWGEFVIAVGRDSAFWAGLRSASKVAPLVLGLTSAALASWCDENPLALVRRAHAATVLRLDGQTSTTAADARLRSAVLLASRAAFDADRVGRTRPVLLAVEDLARAALAHVERTPVTRTDLPALNAARSIMRETLDAVGVAAPVPF